MTSQQRTRNDIDVRCIHRALEAGNGITAKISGYAAVFNVLSKDLGGFREMIKPGAFRKSVFEDDVRALWNHDPNYILGRTKNGTLKLYEDNVGLHFEVIPPAADWAAGLLESIRRGDVDGCSFAFRAVEDDWRSEAGEMIRYLSEVKLFDVSPVVYPAYSETSVTTRSNGLYVGKEFHVSLRTRKHSLMRMELEIRS